MTRCRRLGPLVLCLGAAVMLGGGGSAGAAPPAPLVPGGGSVAGRGYGSWEAAAWRWRLSQPNTEPGTSCFAAGQRGPVWFLGFGYTGATVITRTCTVPAGRYLMLSTPSIDCSTVERAPFHATTNVGLMRCAKAEWRNFPGSLTVTLDGASLRPAGYVGGTAAFSFEMPSHNNILGVPGRTHGRMAVYGSASLLRPLSTGIHTLKVTSGFNGSRLRPVHVTYQLTVG